MVAKMKMNQQEQCNDYTVFIKGTLNDIFKPVTIEFKYDLVQKIPDYDHKFCETCVAIDPNEPKSTTTKIAFSTGCANERCIADLSVVGTLVNVRQPYVLGSTRTIEIKYEISNAGESAYLTSISITIPQNITEFSRIPSTCRQEAVARRTMICDINHGKPIKNRETVELLINLDASKLEGSSFQIVANVSSAADESNPDDNIYQNEILLTEFSDIELNG
jgi:Integrin alpha